MPSLFARVPMLTVCPNDDEKAPFLDEAPFDSVDALSLD